MNHIYLYIMFFLFQSVQQLFAQPKIIHKGIIYTTDGRKIDFHNLSKFENGYCYQIDTNNLFQERNFEDIVKIEKLTGNEALKWGIVSGLIGLAASSFLFITANARLKEIDDSRNIDGTPIIIGVTALGVLTGVIIGKRNKKYLRIYTNPNIINGKF